MERTLSAYGVATFDGFPDVARVMTGVESVRPLAADAHAECVAKVRRVADCLKELGYPDDQVAVTEYKLTDAERGYRSRDGAGGFRAAVKVCARTTAFPRADPGQVLSHFAAHVDALARAGADSWCPDDFRSRMDGGEACVIFSFADFASVEVGLVPRAVADARSKAAQVAETVGGQLGRLLTLEREFLDTGVSGLLSSELGRLATNGVLATEPGPVVSSYRRVFCTLRVRAWYAWS